MWILTLNLDRGKRSQAVMWARVDEATKRGKQKRRVGDLLADERCSPAVLDFLRKDSCTGGGELGQ